MKNIYAVVCGKIAAIAFSLIGLLANAQAPAEAWHRGFNGTANLFDEAKYCRTDAQGNIIITGRSASGPATLLDIVTQKYAPDSTLIWSTSWNNAGYNFDDVPNDIAIAPNGNIIILGYSKTKASSQDINSNIIVLALSPAGAVLWVDSIKGTGYTSTTPGVGFISRCIGFALAIDANNNIYIAGQTTGAPDLYDQMVVAKYNAAGAQQYLLFRDHSTQFSWFDSGSDIGVDANGNVYISGTTTVNTTNMDFAVWKIDSTGSFAWIAIETGPVNNTSEGFDKIIVDAAGNSYAYGISSGEKHVLIKHNAAGVQQWYYTIDTVYPSVTSSFTGADKSLTFSADGNIILAVPMDGKMGIAKFSPAGNLLWLKKHGGTGQYNNEIYSVVTDAGNNIYVSGAYSNAGSSYYDLGAAKFDANGNLLWSVTYNGANNNNDKGHSLAVTPDGSVYVAGFADNNYFLIKYADTPTGVTEIKQGTITIYPNPVNDVVTIEAGATLVGAAYTICDNLGRIAISGRLDIERTNISINALSNGMYFMRVEGLNQPVKLIKR